MEMPIRVLWPLPWSVALRGGVFVDRDRDQTFAATEEVTGGMANEWPVELDAEFVVGINQYTHD